MARDLKLRPFIPSDLNNVSAFLSSNLSEQYRPDVYLEIRRLWPQGFILLETLGQELVGVTAGTFPQPNQVRILILAIDTGYRRQRQGSLMLNTLLEQARQRGANEACLEVKVGTPAIDFYNNHRFQVQQKLSFFYQDGTDALLMTRRLG